MRGLLIHVEAIKSRAAWIRRFIDPAANQRSQHDGERLLQKYRSLGLHLILAKNARDAGIYEVWSRLSTGKLKVFRSCRHWLDKFRTFAQDENGKIINESSYHLMASTRYLFLGAMASWQQKPQEKPEELDYWERLRRSGGYFPGGDFTERGGWMG